jgi:hypothetical protein
MALNVRGTQLSPALPRPTSGATSACRGSRRRANPAPFARDAPRGRAVKHRGLVKVGNSSPSNRPRPLDELNPAARSGAGPVSDKSARTTRRSRRGRRRAVRAASLVIEDVARSISKDDLVGPLEPERARVMRSQDDLPQGATAAAIASKNLVRIERLDRAEKGRSPWPGTRPWRTPGSGRVARQGIAKAATAPSVSSAGRRNQARRQPTGVGVAPAEAERCTRDRHAPGQRRACVRCAIHGRLRRTSRWVAGCHPADIRLSALRAARGRRALALGSSPQAPFCCPRPAPPHNVGQPKEAQMTRRRRWSWLGGRLAAVVLISCSRWLRTPFAMRHGRT